MEGHDWRTARTRTARRTCSRALTIAAAAAASFWSGVAGAWVAPIGIPEPDFGIHETIASVYGSEDHYTHFVNNADPAATDDNNPFGSPAQPRRTIPSVLSAGSVVYVHGGVYSAGGIGTLRGNGTAALPVFIRGNPAARPKIQIETTFIGTYFIIEYLDFDGPTAQGNVLGPSDRVCIRHCEVRNAQGSGAGLVAVGSWDSSTPTTVRNIVFYDNLVHDLGDLGAQTDQDHHGFVIGHHANNIWMVDNEIYNTSGSGLQVNSGFLDETGDRPAHHVYVGRNHVHHVRQSGLTVKKARDVVFSQNVVHDVISTPWSVSKGLAYQYGPYNLWYIYNHLYNNEWGINGPSNDGGPGGDVYHVGNLIHDCGMGITCWNNRQTTYIVGNTIADCGGGIRYENGPGMRLANNIIANLSSAEHINVFGGSGSTASSSTTTHDLFDQSGGPVRIKWSSNTYTSVSAFQAATGKGEGDLEGDPLFVDPGGGDYHALPGSPATDSGVASHVYDLYLGLFGQDIAVDRDGVPRTAGLGHDIGCYEQYQYQTCLNPAECDDGVDCTVDDCISGYCSHVPDHSLCPDDGLYCTGTEICSVWLGCISTGNPCPFGQACIEETDTCSGVQADTLYVNHAAGGANDGSSWANAFRDLQDALFAASLDPYITEIWVAQGVYRPDQNTGIRSASFALIDGLGVYGGFRGDEAARRRRDVNLYATVLCGDLENNDDQGWPYENSYHVVTAAGVGPSAVLDGFTIRRGYADGFFSGEGDGAAVYVVDGSPTLQNCIIEQNRAADYGGGLYATGWGGPTLIHCTLRENRARNGGGLEAVCESLSMTNCTVVDNTASWPYARAGGISWGGGQLDLTNCTVVDNVSTGRGGGISSVAGSLVVRNCTVAGNHGSPGGGLDAQGGTQVSIANSIFWGNEPAYPSLEEAQINSNGVNSNGFIHHSCVQGWSGALGGEGNIGDDPQFLNAFTGNYRLTAASACVDRGNNAEVAADVNDLDGDGNTWEPVPYDLDRNPRFIQGSGEPGLRSVTVDMGAFEFQVAGPATGDFDEDGDVDAADYETFVGCMTGISACGPMGCGPADIDGDDDVDLNDFDGMAPCVFGPAVGPVGGDCTVFDLNADERVDLRDFALFQAEFVSPYPNPACDLADFNADGVVDLLDFAIFQQAYTG